MVTFGGTRFSKGKSAVVAGALVVLALGGGEVVATAGDPGGAVTSGGVAADGAGVVPSRAQTAGVGVSSSGEPQGGKYRRVMLRQARMDAWIARILGPAYSLDFKGPEGFGGVWLDPDVGSVTFAWKGEPGRRVARKLARPPKGVSVTVTSAAYTQAELDVATGKLWERCGKLRRSTGWSLVESSPSQTGSGLDAEVVAVSGADQDGLKSTRGVFSKAVGVPVTVTKGERVTLAQGPRWKPDQPWRSGAALLTPLGRLCSSGVAGKDKGGRNVFITAEHCGEVKGGKYYAMDGNNPPKKGSKFGEVWDVLPKHDTALVGATGKVTALIYTGDWNAPKSKYKVVGSAGDSQVGDYVCTSGANSGVHCKLKVTKTKTCAASKGKIPFCPWVKAVASSGIAVAEGDSGGPVFMGPGKKKQEDKRQVRGTISGGRDFYACPSGSVAIPGNLCSSRVYFAPIKKALSDFKVTLVKR
ncbi:MAG: hypothetical protein U0904_06295 [Candidatus Nanopelagicales bacterium]|nr:hypothetical protein [Candidatus Nanopelagicales bacterium]